MFSTLIIWLLLGVWVLFGGFVLFWDFFFFVWLVSFPFLRSREHQLWLDVGVWLWCTDSPNANDKFPKCLAGGFCLYAQDYTSCQSWMNAGDWIQLSGRPLCVLQYYVSKPQFNALAIELCYQQVHDKCLDAFKQQLETAFFLKRNYRNLSVPCIFLLLKFSFLCFQRRGEKKESMMAVPGLIMMIWCITSFSSVQAVLQCTDCK